MKMAEMERDIIHEYQRWCDKNCIAEVMSTASYFAEHYLNKGTKVNGRRIAELYAYVKEKEALTHV